MQGCWIQGFQGINYKSIRQGKKKNEQWSSYLLSSMVDLFQRQVFPKLCFLLFNHFSLKFLTESAKIALKMYLKLDDFDLMFRVIVRSKPVVCVLIKSFSYFLLFLFLSQKSRVSLCTRFWLRESSPCWTTFCSTWLVQKWVHLKSRTSVSSTLSRSSSFLTSARST